MSETLAVLLVAVLIALGFVVAATVRSRSRRAAAREQEQNRYASPIVRIETYARPNVYRRPIPRQQDRRRARDSEPTWPAAVAAVDSSLSTIDTSSDYLSHSSRDFEPGGGHSGGGGASGSWDSGSDYGSSSGGGDYGGGGDSGGGSSSSD